ncbi:MAG TPA: YggT family protein [Anaerolineae bacterium]|jgi:YggT family protein|nr:YggT family protein [Ardenticatenia bacterium]HQZ70922.1 YggT family protein [Anaerolineae bacterium]
MDVLILATVYGLRFLQLAVLVRVLLSWVDSSPYPDSRWKEVLFTVTDPILNPLRRIIPPVGGMIDLTPMAAIILLQVLESLVGSLGTGGYAPRF